MKRVLAGLAAAIALTATMAFADDAQGTVKALDAAAMTLTLDNDTVYVLPADFDVTSVQVGDAVAITYSVDNGQNVASDITLQ